MNNNKFSWRSFISFGLTFAFIFIFVTGIVLYIAPPGRVAHWVNWKIAGLTKEEWQAIHIVFSLLFVILSIFHLFSINWKVFLSYIKTKTSSGLNKKKELLYSTLLTLVVFFGILISIPPFSSVIALSENFKESWEQPEEEPPIPHAELLSLKQVNEKLDNINLDQIEKRLKEHKISFNSTDQTLGEIGKINNISPSEVYNAIVKKGDGHNARSSGSGMGMRGLGKKTLFDIANENNKDVMKILKTLEENNIQATKDQTLKDIATEYDMPARDIFIMITDSE